MILWCYFFVKNNKNFFWYDDGIVKDRRRLNEKYYRFCFFVFKYYLKLENEQILKEKKCVYVFVIFIFNFDLIFYRL